MSGEYFVEVKIIMRKGRKIKIIRKDNIFRLVWLT